MNGRVDFIKPRYEHKDALCFWNVITHEKAVWSKDSGGLGFADYYYVQHKLFKKIRRVKCFGYRAKEHPKYQMFCEKYGMEGRRK